MLRITKTWTDKNFKPAVKQANNSLTCFPGVRTVSGSEDLLSQWYSASFQVNDTQDRTAEHWMRAAKARLFNDDEILVAPDPKIAKALGRKVHNFDDAVWKLTPAH